MASRSRVARAVEVENDTDRRSSGVPSGNAHASHADKEARAPFCTCCEHDVYDLSSMAQEDAEALLLAHGVKLSLHPAPNADVAPRTRTPGLWSTRRVRRTTAVVASLLAVTLAGLLLYEM